MPGKVNTCSSVAGLSHVRPIYKNRVGSWGCTANGDARAGQNIARKGTRVLCGDSSWLQWIAVYARNKECWFQWTALGIWKVLYNCGIDGRRKICITLGGMQIGVNRDLLS